MVTAGSAAAGGGGGGAGAGATPGAAGSGADGGGVVVLCVSHQRFSTVAASKECWRRLRLVSSIAPMVPTPMGGLYWQRIGLTSEAEALPAPERTVPGCVCAANATELAATPDPATTEAVLPPKAALPSEAVVQRQSPEAVPPPVCRPATTQQNGGAMPAPRDPVGQGFSTPSAGPESGPNLRDGILACRPVTTQQNGRAMPAPRDPVGQGFSTPSPGPESGPNLRDRASEAHGSVAMPGPRVRIAVPAAAPGLNAARPRREAGFRRPRLRWRQRRFRRRRCWAGSGASASGRPA